LSPPAQQPDRYLWTDAFAICNFLALFQRTGDQQYRHYAKELIDQVHRVLGRYRDDDVRSGWISGFDEDAGHYHPTAGGLRIGKPLKERNANEVLDDRLEWDRDGQYFHYLTKWIHALCQAAFVTGEPNYSRWAVELGNAAFKGFLRRSGSGEVVGFYWKMSTDLSRPLVPATGLHDTLDGFLTFREALHATANSPIDAETTNLSSAVESLSVLCRNRDFTTEDPLGIGGLLFDALRLCQLIGRNEHGDVHLLEQVLTACANGLARVLASRYLDHPMSHRLAFRELGMAIGLKALPLIANAINDHSFGSSIALRETIQTLLPYEALGKNIIDVWLPHSAQAQDRLWQAHQNINDVMLATALAPAVFLSVGVRQRTS
jgi:hypothetical protein